MTDGHEPTEFRRSGRRARTYVPARVLVTSGGRWRRTVSEYVVDIGTVSVSGVAFEAPDSIDLLVWGEAVLCIGHQEAPVKVHRREPQLHGTISYAVEFLDLPAGMRAEIESILRSDAAATAPR